jgi:hypothetical protein
MSYKRKDQLSRSPEWHKHLGRFLHRLFWKKERKAGKKLIENEINEPHNNNFSKIRLL